MWWEKISKVLVQIGFRKQRMCLGLFTLHCAICLHADDMLGIGDELFDSKLKERWIRLDEETKFRSLRNQNLRKSDLTLERTKQLDDELSASESHEFRGINGCLQWVTKEFLYPFQFVVKVLQRRQGQARVRDLLKAN